ncbi:MAG TPA: hypothetical protein VHQ65_06105 [Thermoanaerobaculia bacterium]|nr:hypothetical protein [Thermoanaerobaculia bacterium]
MTGEIVLLLTHSEDFYTVDRVAEHLERRGARPVRLDTDRFPGEIRLTQEVAGGRTRHRISGPGIAEALGTATLDAAEVAAVWTRRFWPAPLEGLAPEFHRECRLQIRETLEGFLDGLGGARWINDLAPLWRAGNKLRQLRLAAELGLAVPRTVVTNDPEPVRSLYRATGGRVVTKLLLPLSMSMTVAPRSVPTSALGDDDLEALDGLDFAPMIFQEHLAKREELRVVMIAGRAYVGSIDASRSAAGQTDWHLASVDEVAWRPGHLDAAVSARLAALHDALGLVSGVSDFIVTPQGEAVFLEVNPLGEWGMLERDLGLPISEAFAAALLGQSPPEREGPDREPPDPLTSNPGLRPDAAKERA